jgi:hypothetical protein
MANPPRQFSAAATADLQFPSDLTNSHRSFYFNIQFHEYNRAAVDVKPQLAPTGRSIILPMPDKINDNPFVTWADSELLSIEGLALAAAPRGIGTIASTASIGAQWLSGHAANPYLAMLFKKPGFKRFSFTWTLAPVNEQETNAVNDIIKELRRGMLPSAGSQGLGRASPTLKYPYLVGLSFTPSDYLFQFKPAAIENIQVEYNPAGAPSFFENGSPTEVRLTLNVVEVEYWLREDYGNF